MYTSIIIFTVLSKFDSLNVSVKYQRESFIKGIVQKNDFTLCVFIDQSFVFCNVLPQLKTSTVL